MTTWGVDLGVRSIYAARLDGGTLSLFSHKSLRLNKQPRYEELRTLQDWLSDTIREGEVWIEEPPLAGRRNPRVFLHLSQVSALAGLAGEYADYVPVASWKHGTVGNGSATKEQVSQWLSRRHPGFHRQCDGDQNFIDAVCVALFGLGQSGSTAFR